MIHHGNKQIHEDQLYNNCGSKEENPHCNTVGLRVVVLVEITKTSQVSMNHGIKRHKPCKAVKYRFCILTTSSMIMTVELKDHDAVREGSKHHQKHEREDADALHNSFNHADECSKWFEDSHPIEHLKPHNQNCSSSNQVDCIFFERVIQFTEHVGNIQDKRCNIH